MLVYMMKHVELFQIGNGLFQQFSITKLLMNLYHISYLSCRMQASVYLKNAHLKANNRGVLFSLIILQMMISMI